mgnify:CR=1 FL=1
MSKNLSQDRTLKSSQAKIAPTNSALVSVTPRIIILHDIEVSDSDSDSDSESLISFESEPSDSNSESGCEISEDNNPMDEYDYQYLEGLSHYFQANYDLAESELTLIPKDHNTYLKSVYYIAMCYGAQHRWHDMIVCLAKIPPDSELFIESQILMCHAWHQIGKLSESLAQMDHLLDKQNKPNELIIRQTIMVAKSQADNSQLLIGQMYLMLKKNQAALKCFSTIEYNHPLYWQAQLAIGLLYAQYKEMHTYAINILDQIPENDNSYADAQFTLSEIYTLLNLHFIALNALKLCLKEYSLLSLYPKILLSLIKMKCIYEQLDMNDENIKIHMQIADAYLNLNDTTSAMSFLKAIPETSYLYSNAQLKLSILLLKLNQTEPSLQHYNQAISSRKRSFSLFKPNPMTNEEQAIITTTSQDADILSASKILINFQTSETDRQKRTHEMVETSNDIEHKRCRRL